MHDHDSKHQIFTSVQWQSEENETELVRFYNEDADDSCVIQDTLQLIKMRQRDHRGGYRVRKPRLFTKAVIS